MRQGRVRGKGMLEFLVLMGIREGGLSTTRSRPGAGSGASILDLPT